MKTRTCKLMPYMHLIRCRTASVSIPSTLDMVDGTPADTHHSASVQYLFPLSLQHPSVQTRTPIPP